MRVLPVLACAVTLALLPTEGSALQATVFKGRLVVSPGAPPVTQMRIRLGTHGVVAPKADGSFVGVIPASATAILLTVETGSDKYQAWHPRLAVAVPKDTNLVTEVLVGPTVEASLQRLFAADAAQRTNALRALGVNDSLIVSLLQELRVEFAEQTKMRAQDLELAAATGAKRAEFFPVMSAAIERYVTKLHNLQLAFHYIAEQAFTNDSAFAHLRQAIVDYNPPFELIKAQRDSFVTYVKDYWGSEALAGEMQSTLDFALADIHTLYILPLNDLRQDIAAVLKGDVRGRAATQKKQETMARIRSALGAIEPRVTELTRRKTQLLARLQSI